MFVTTTNTEYMHKDSPCMGDIRHNNNNNNLGNFLKTSLQLI